MADVVLGFFALVAGTIVVSVIAMAIAVVVCFALELQDRRK